MRKGHLQLNDIPNEPILRFLSTVVGLGGCSFLGFSNSVSSAMPAGVSKQLILKKMQTLIDEGLVDGCACGCRGDYELTPKAKALIENFPLF